MTEKKETRTRYSFDFSNDAAAAALVTRVLEETEPGGNLHSQLAGVCQELEDARHPKPEPDCKPGVSEIPILVKFIMSDAWKKEEILAGRQPVMDQDLEIRGELCPPYLLDLPYCEYHRGQICLDLRKQQEIEVYEFCLDRTEGEEEHCEGSGVATWKYRSHGRYLRFDAPPGGLANVEARLISCLYTPEMHGKEEIERTRAEDAVRSMIADEAEAEAEKKAAKAAKRAADEAAAATETARNAAKKAEITANLSAWIDAGNGSDHPRNLRSEGFPWPVAARAEILEELLSETPYPVAGTPAGMENEHIRDVDTPRSGLLARYSAAKKWLTGLCIGPKAHKGLKIGPCNISLCEYSEIEDGYRHHDAETFRRYELSCAVDWPEYGFSETVHLDLTKKTE